MGLEFTLDNLEWHPAPETITISQYYMICFRVAEMETEDQRGTLPIWNTDATVGGDDVEMDEDGSLRVEADSLLILLDEPGSHFVRVAYAGTTTSVAITPTPKYRFWGEASKSNLLAGIGDTALTQCDITVYVRDTNNVGVPDVPLVFRATASDEELPGMIDPDFGPGYSATTDVEGKAKVRVTGLSRTDLGDLIGTTYCDILATAPLLESETITPTIPIFVHFSLPSYQYEIGPWSETGDGRKQAVCQFKVTFFNDDGDDVPVGNRPVQIYGYVAPTEPGETMHGRLIHAIAFDHDRGVTDDDGVFTCTIFWTPPAPQFQPESYEIIVDHVAWEEDY